MRYSSSIAEQLEKPWNAATVVHLNVYTHQNRPIQPVRFRIGQLRLYEDGLHLAYGAYRRQPSRPD